MDNEILIELGIEGLSYSIYDVAVNSLFECVRKKLSDSHVLHSSLNINYSKNRILINFNFLRKNYTDNRIVEMVQSVLNTVHIPIKGLKYSNNLKDYVVWIQGVVDDKELDFSSFNPIRKTELPIFKIKNIESYREELKNNNIIFETDKRKNYFLKLANKISREHGGEIRDIDYLVEKFIAKYNMPHPIIGNFNPTLLNQPLDLIVSILMDICNVLPIFTDKGQLTPYYIHCIEEELKEDDKYINKLIDDTNNKLSKILDGWNKILNEDYEVYQQKMKEMIMPERVGTLFDKSNRIKDLAVIIGDYLLVGDETKSNISSASEIAKFDLTTDLVKSYPQLKGVVGYLYAKEMGKNDIISSAVKSHYKPKYFHDSLPDTTTGKVLSLADKFDEISNYFIYSKLNESISEYQTSEIRRYASAIIKLVLKNKWNLNMENLINDCLYLYIKNGEMVLDVIELKNEIYNFILLKFREDVVRNYNDYCRIDDLINRHPNNLLEAYENLIEGESDEKR